MDDGDTLLTYSQAAEFLNIKLGTLYALVAHNRVPHIRLGKRLVRFSRHALERWLRERAVQPRVLGLGTGRSVQD
jgi:excisionase family DNA binding protein